MFSIGVLDSNNQEYHFIHEYYDRGSRPGVILGSGAEVLGVHGQTPKRVEFLNILRGFSFDGSEKWTRNAGSGPIEYRAKDGTKKTRDRQYGHDYCLSAPKPFSAWVAVVPPELREQGLECHRQAVNAVISQMEDLAQTRTGAGGKTIEPAKPLFFVWEHYSTRRSQPGVHSHIVTPNLCVGAADGKTRTLLSRPYYANQHMLDRVYKAELEHQLRSRLGLDLKSIPQDLMHHWSKGKREIDEASKGSTDPKERERTNRRIRRAKKSKPIERQFAAWQQEASTFGFTPELAAGLTNRITRPIDERRELSEAMRAAVRAMPPRFTERELFYAALEQGRQVPAEMLREGVTRYLDARCTEEDIRQGERVYAVIRRPEPSPPMRPVQVEPCRKEEQRHELKPSF